MKNLTELKEKAARYKRFYPEKYSKLDDTEVLLRVCAINQFEANQMRRVKPIKERKVVVRKPQDKKDVIRPYTFNQISKMCKAAMKDLRSDMPNEAEDPGFESSAAFDMAEGWIATDARVRKYLEKSGVQRIYWGSTIADFYF